MDTTRLLPLDTTLTTLFEDGDPHAAGRAHERRNLGCVSRIFGAVLAGDYDHFEAELTPDVEFQLTGPSELPLRCHARGPAEVRKLVEHNFAATAEQEPQFVSLTAQGDQMVLIGREKGRVRESGQPYEVQFIYAFTFQDGKVSRITEYTAACA